MKTHLSRFTAFLLLVSLMVTGCYGESKPSSNQTTSPTAPAQQPAATPQPEPTAAASPQVLNVPAGNEIPNMNSTGVIDTLSNLVMNNVFEGLYRLDPNNKPVPGMAESYDVSADGKTYTFHLRKDAVWSNGKPVTAKDFEYAWRKALHPDTISPYAYMMVDIKNAAAIQDDKNPLFGKVDQLGAKATDDQTFVVELENAVPYFLGLTAFPTFFPQSEEFVKEQGEKYALEAETLLYNGPFVLESWKHEEGWVYKKNPKYWDQASVKLEQVNAKVVKDVSTRVNLYEAGEIDLAEITSDFVDQFKDTPGYSTYQKPEVFWIRMNQSNKFLANVNIRKAFNMGWDKDSLAKVILNDGSTAADYMVPKNFVNGPDGQDFRAKYAGFSPFDAAKAQEHWKKGLAELKTDKISLEFLSYDGESNKKIAEYIKNQLEKNLPGLTITINMQPNKQKLALEKKLSYELDFSGWSPDYQDPVAFVELYDTKGPYNWQKYSNPKYDELVRKAKTVFTDLNARWADLQEAERILIEEDAAISPMYQKGVALLTKPYVKGYVVHPFAAVASYKWVTIEGKQ